MIQALVWAAAGTGFTFAMTSLGAAMVFFLRRKSSALLQRIFLGFAAGVMIAASVWSLLIPAIEEAEAAGGIGWICTAVPSEPRGCPPLSGAPRCSCSP